MGTFGQRLRELRNQRGISQNELSKYIGVSKSSVNMYERGEREPGFETLEAIADFFNVNMDYLLGRKNSSPSTDVGQESIENVPNLSEKDQQRMTSTVERMKKSGERVAIFRTSSGQVLFLFCFENDPQELPEDN